MCNEENKNKPIKYVSEFETNEIGCDDENESEFYEAINNIKINNEKDNEYFEVINNITIINKSDPIKISAQIDEIIMDFELDTGSAMSILPEEIYNRYFKNKLLYMNQISNSKVMVESKYTP